jgi:AraC family transcriptional regulator
MMNHEIQPSTVRRTLFAGELLQIGHVAVRPASSECGEIEESDANVLALTLAGVFARHDGPRRHVIATPNHALFISAGMPYRLSFPGCIGDRCLVLRFSGEALAQALPDALACNGFDTSIVASHSLLGPGTILSRTLLWRGLERGEIDALEVEERGICLLAAAVQAAHEPRRGRTPMRGVALRRRRQVETVKEVIAIDPERKWTLGDLAGLACVSPGHLAHVFSAEEGSSLYQYVLRSRLARALDAVLDSDTDLTAIALDAGFASHSHFTARFRAHFGRTPRELRRGNGDGAVNDLRRIVTAREAATA